MAIVKSSFHFFTGGTETSELSERVVEYQAISDDPKDGFQTILDHLNQVEGVNRGDAYDIPGTNEYNPNINLKSIDPTPPQAQDEGDILWILTLTYNNESEEEEPEDPEDEDQEGANPEIVPIFQLQREVLEKAEFRGVQDIDGKKKGRPPGFALDKLEVMRHSNHVPYIPACETDKSLFGFVLAYDIPRWDNLIQDLHGSVNNNEVTVSWVNAGRVMFREKFKKYELWISNISAPVVVRNDIEMYRLQVEVLFNEDGWRLAKLDQGRMAEAEIPEVGTPIKEDPIPGAKDIKDVRGEVVTDEVPLDGKGKPLGVDERVRENYRYLIWSQYKEFPFLHGRPFLWRLES